MANHVILWLTGKTKWIDKMASGAVVLCTAERTLQVPQLVYRKNKTLKGRPALIPMQAVVSMLCLAQRAYLPTNSACAKMCPFMARSSSFLLAPAFN